MIAIRTVSVRDTAIFGGVVVLLIGLAWLFVIMVQRERAEVTAFCQPRGYIGGRLAWRGVGSMCIDKDHAEVLIEEIKRSEKDKSFQPRRSFFPF